MFAVGKPMILPPLDAADDRPVQRERPAQQPVHRRPVAGFQGGADGGGADDAAVLDQRPERFDLEAQLAPELRQQVGVALAPAAEREVGPDEKEAHSQPLVAARATNSRRGELRHLRREGERQDEVDAAFAQERAPALPGSSGRRCRRCGFRTSAGWGCRVMTPAGQAARGRPLVAGWRADSRWPRWTPSKTPMVSGRLPVEAGDVQLVEQRRGRRSWLPRPPEPSGRAERRERPARSLPACAAESSSPPTSRKRRPFVSASASATSAATCSGVPSADGLDGDAAHDRAVALLAGSSPRPGFAASREAQLKAWTG